MLPLPWLSQCCWLCQGLLPSWPLVPQASRECCSQSPKASTETSSLDSGKMRSPPRVSDTSGSGGRSELAQAEELLEQQLELYQALLEGQEGVWEAQALVLKIQKLKEQMRHREVGGEMPKLPTSPQLSLPYWKYCTPPPTSRSIRNIPASPRLMRKPTEPSKMGQKLEDSGEPQPLPSA
ncbi:LOW QUALITY PROTEIN: mitochondrial coiled-coil domain protein 1 [Trichechus inunguis]